MRRPRRARSPPPDRRRPASFRAPWRADRPPPGERPRGRGPNRSATMIVLAARRLDQHEAVAADARSLFPGSHRPSKTGARDGGVDGIAAALRIVDGGLRRSGCDVAQRPWFGEKIRRSARCVEIAHRVPPSRSRIGRKVTAGTARGQGPSRAVQGVAAMPPGQVTRNGAERGIIAAIPPACVILRDSRTPLSGRCPRQPTCRTGEDTVAARDTDPARHVGRDGGRLWPCCRWRGATGPGRGRAGAVERGGW